MGIESQAIRIVALSPDKALHADQPEPPQLANGVVEKRTSLKNARCGPGISFCKSQMERILRAPETDAGSLPLVSWSASGSRVPVLAIKRIAERWWFFYDRGDK